MTNVMTQGQYQWQRGGQSGKKQIFFHRIRRGFWMTRQRGAAASALVRRDSRGQFCQTERTKSRHYWPSWGYESTFVAGIEFPEKYVTVTCGDDGKTLINLLHKIQYKIFNNNKYYPLIYSLFLKNFVVNISRQDFKVDYFL